MAERYEIKGRLGRGGIGAIYRAFDTVMGRDVAIKRLLPIEQTKLNEAADESLQREAAALARLSHPNILTIYAFEEDEEGPYVVTELVEGENLKETIERGALPLEDFEGVVEQTLEPLIAAHTEGLLHRDLKPANIMLHWLSTGRFQIKILDFGLSKFSQQPSLQTLDQTGSFLGSIDYIAPEQIDLKPLDFRTDLYSLGCVYYFALAQKPPFEDEAPALTMRRHLEHNVRPIHELRADLPTPIADWVMRLISRHPQDRPDSAGDALREFAAACSGTSPIDALVPVAELASDAEPSPHAATEQAADVTAQATGPLTPTGKTLLTSPATPTRRQTAASRPSAKRKSSAAKKPGTTWQDNPLKWPIAALIAAIVLSAIVVPLVLNRDNDDSGEDDTSTANERNRTGSGSDGDGGSGKQVRASSGSMAHADKLPRTLPKGSRAKPPPVTENLIGHYDAAASTFQEDLKTPAKEGDRVAAWGNLASKQPFHYLARLNDRRDQIPTLTKGSPKSHPALNGNHPLLQFDGNSGLRIRADSQKSIDLDQQQLSFFVVLRAEHPNGHIIKFDGKNKRWNFMTAIAQKNSYVLSLRKDQGKARTVTTQKGPLQQFVIYSAKWNGAEGSQVLRLTRSDGQREISDPTPINATPVDLVGYLVGTPNKPDASAKAARFTGYIAALLVYSRCLDDDEFIRVEDHLFAQYFKKAP